MRCKLHLKHQNATSSKVSQNVILKRKSIRKTSEKQQVSNIKVRQAKTRVMQKHLDLYGYFFCKSCGTKEDIINVSHLVPIGYNKSLEANEDNLTLHCQHGCHPKWERLTEEIKDFKDFKELLSRVKRLDESYYNKILSKIE